jgi:hypothetical protein
MEKLAELKKEMIQSQEEAVKYIDMALNAKGTEDFIKYIKKAQFCHGKFIGMQKVIDSIKE